MSWNVTHIRPEVAARLHQMAAGLQAQGMGPVDAKQTALRAMAGHVAIQGTVLGLQDFPRVGGRVSAVPPRFFSSGTSGNRARQSTSTLNIE